MEKRGLGRWGAREGHEAKVAAGESKGAYDVDGILGSGRGVYARRSYSGSGRRRS